MRKTNPPQPTSAELSRDETPGKAVMRTFEFQEYDVGSAAEAMPEDKWDFRPAAGVFKNEKPEFGPAEVRTFREQLTLPRLEGRGFTAISGKARRVRKLCVRRRTRRRYSACGMRPGGPQPGAHPRRVAHLSPRLLHRAAEAAPCHHGRKHVRPMHGPYAIPNTRLGLAVIAVWHNADHFGQMAIYLRQNGIVPPGSRNPRPKLQEKY